jgi:asparagine synthase (glutamine-hydrolysing)
MVASILHRGPDDTGFYLDQNVGLANARLSIIDVEGGHQPISNETGTVQVTYNGETYNFQTLRARLEERGHRFRTRSDTEAIVHGYEEYGEEIISKLNGMFAIAIWDSEQKKLVLARDRMGIKPLYYTLQDGVLYFGSEMKAILQAPCERSVNVQSLWDILNVGYIPGEESLLEGIKKLPPSCILIFQDGRLELREYWHIPALAGDVDEDQLVKQLQKVLEESVRDQLVADESVPVGCFLSGGLDTSSIVAYAAKARSKPLKTFCMGFGEDTDELKDARLIAEQFGTEHYELTVDSSQGMKLYPKMIWHMEAPKYNLYPWFVCELVHKYVKVCLSGNGGDEVFGGYYARYRNALRIEKLASSLIAPVVKGLGKMLQSIPEDAKTKNQLRAAKSLGDQTSEYLVLAGALPESEGRVLRNGQIRPDTLKEHYAKYFAKNGSFLQGLMNAELRTKLVDDLLSVDDTMGMAHSLELRVPLLDNRIVDLMVTVPWQMKFQPGTHGKLLLRKVVRDILPEASLRKPKWGFSVDVYSWHKGELGELIRQVVPESPILKQYFRQEWISKLLKTPSSPRNRRSFILLWQLLGFHYWHRIFVESEAVDGSRLEVDTLAA